MISRKTIVNERIYGVVRQIPPGKVATYGQIARLAGLHGQARRVGFALRVCSERDLPWHRVVNSRGRISRRTMDGGSEQTQYFRLRAEGIRFGRLGQIRLGSFLWRPEGLLKVAASRDNNRSL